MPSPHLGSGCSYCSPGKQHFPLFLTLSKTNPPPLLISRWITGKDTAPRTHQQIGWDIPFGEFLGHSIQSESLGNRTQIQTASP